MNQYIKIQQIADDLSEHPLLRDVSFERIINYAFELIRILGCPKLYEDKVSTIDIVNYRGELPCDFVEVISVAGCNGKEYVTTEDMFFIDDPCRPTPKGNCAVGSIEIKQREVKEGCNSYLERTVIGHAPTDQIHGVGAYKIQGNIIFVDIPNTTLKVAYRSIVLDEDGFPMLPNNATLIRAIEAYITVKRFEILFSMGKISGQVLQVAQQEYAWSVGQAANDLVMPTIDEMETFTHMWNTLIPRMTEHRNGFATAHLREHLKRH